MTGAGSDVDVIWDEFEDWLGRHQSRKLVTLRPPATVAEVTELEVTLGRDLPGDVRRSLLRHDGEQEYQRSMHPAFALLSATEAAQTISGNRRLGEEEDFGDWWWRDSYLPIASSGSGDYCCIDLDAEPGADDRVIIWYHDDLDRPPVGTSYVQWLSQVVQDYRRTWDLDLLEPWAGHREIIEDLDWSGDGSRLLTVGDHCLARLWDAKSGRAIADIDDVPSRTFTARFSPDGTRFAVAGSYLRIFDTDRPGDVAVPLPTPQRWYSTSIGWLPDGDRIAAVTMDQLEVWDTRTGTLEIAVPLDDALRGERTLAVSPRGEAIVVVASSAMARVDLAPGAASVANMVTTQRRFHGFAADWSPDADVFAVTDYSGVDVFDGQSLEVASQWSIDGRSGWSVRWSPDGRYLAASGDRCQVWAPASGDLVAQFEDEPLTEPHHSITVAWAPSGTQLATGDVAGRLRVWTLGRGGG